MMSERGFYWATTHWSITWGNQNQLRCVTSFGPMEPVVGFKPTTYALQVRCSIN